MGIHHSETELRVGIAPLRLGFKAEEFAAKVFGLLCSGVGQCHAAATQQR